MVKGKRSKTNGDMPVQVIAGRDGKPAYAVLPLEVFATLLAYAREGVKKTSNETDRPLDLKRRTRDEYVQRFIKKCETTT